MFNLEDYSYYWFVCLLACSFLMYIVPKGTINIYDIFGIQGHKHGQKKLPQSFEYCLHSFGKLWWVWFLNFPKRAGIGRYSTQDNVYNKVNSGQSKSKHTQICKNTFLHQLLQILLYVLILHNCPRPNIGHNFVIKHVCPRKQQKLSPAEESHPEVSLCDIILVQKLCPELWRFEGCKC